MNTWNAYPEKEPPRERDLLVYVSKGGYTFNGEDYMAIDRFIPWNDEPGFRTDKFNYGTVIAWMELPEPPVVMIDKKD